MLRNKLREACLAPTTLSNTTQHFNTTHCMCLPGAHDEGAVDISYAWLLLTPLTYLIHPGTLVHRVCYVYIPAATSDYQVVVLPPEP